MAAGNGTKDTLPHCLKVIYGFCHQGIIQNSKKYPLQYPQFVFSPCLQLDIMWPLQQDRRVICDEQAFVISKIQTCIVLFYQPSERQMNPVWSTCIWKSWDKGIFVSSLWLVSIRVSFWLLYDEVSIRITFHHLAAAGGIQSSSVRKNIVGRRQPSKKSDLRVSVHRWQQHLPRVHKKPRCVWPALVLN